MTVNTSRRSSRVCTIVLAACILLYAGVVLPFQKASDFSSYFDLHDEGSEIWSVYFQGPNNASLQHVKVNASKSIPEPSFNVSFANPIEQEENQSDKPSPQNDTNQTNKTLVPKPTQPTSLANATISHNNSMILTFVTIEFVRFIDFWYSRLTDLGYTEHVVAAWDEETYQHCQAKGWRTLRCISSGQKGPKSKGQEFRRTLFAARWHCVHQQLQEGNNILLTDVDNTFQRYVPLSSFEEYNVIHAFGGGYPPRHLKRHGFTVCGGMTWLQSAPPTLKYVGMILDECTTRCDDQGKINNMFSTLNITWTIKPLEQQLPSNHNWPEPAGSRHGISAVTGHSVMIWDTGFAFRGPLSASPCPTNPWVAMPVNEKNKKVHDQWQSKCPPPIQNTTSVNSSSAR